MTSSSHWPGAGAVGAELIGFKVRASYDEERFFVRLPETLSPIIGRQGALRCRLRSIARPGKAASECRHEFDTAFDETRRLFLPRAVANAFGVVEGGTVDIAIEALIRAENRLFGRRIAIDPVYPHDQVALHETRPPAEGPSAGRAAAEPPRLRGPVIVRDMNAEASGGAEVLRLAAWQMVGSAERRRMVE